MNSESRLEEIMKSGDIEMLYEIRGVYDGWSVAKMKDGSLINRWLPDDRRWQAAEDFIGVLKAK